MGFIVGIKALQALPHMQENALPNYAGPARQTVSQGPPRAFAGAYLHSDTGFHIHLQKQELEHS